MAAPVTGRRFTVTDYDRMVAAGILGEDDHAELIAGEIVEMSPRGPFHVATVNALNKVLSRLTREDLIVSVQNPVRIRPHSEPEPDVVLLRSRSYRGALPTPQDVLLLIEVSDSSLIFDHEVKLPLYAAAGIAEVWVVDLVTLRLERYSDPSSTGYRQFAEAHLGERLRSTVLPALSLDVDEVLG